MNKTTRRKTVLITQNMNYLHRLQAAKFDMDTTGQSFAETELENGSMQDLFSDALCFDKVPDTFALDADGLPSSGQEENQSKTGLPFTENFCAVVLLEQIPQLLSEVPMNHLNYVNAPKKSDIAQVGILSGTSKSDYVFTGTDEFSFDTMKQTEQQPASNTIHNRLIDGNPGLQFDSQLPNLGEVATFGKLPKVTFVEQLQPVTPLEFQRNFVAEDFKNGNSAAQTRDGNLFIDPVDIPNAPAGLVEFNDFLGTNTSSVANKGMDGSPSRMVRVDASFTVNVVKQVADAMISSTDKTIEIRLDPPELGKLRLIMEISATSVQVIVSSERSELLDFMRRNSETLTREFIAQGFNNVQLDFQSRGNHFREHGKLGKSSDQISQSATSDLEILPDVSSQLNVAIELGRLDLRF